jgi:maltose alpha-D-glucosyltransferase / alpha-amylase
MDDAIFTTEAGRQRLAQEWLPPWLRTRRWFGAKDRAIQACRMARITPFGTAWLCAVEVQFADGATETYVIPLTQVESAEAAAVIAPANGRMLIDATHVPEFRVLLFHVLAGRERVAGIEALQGVAFAQRFPGETSPVSRVLAVEQSNTSVIYGDRLFLKLFRKLEAGLNPDVEMARFLGERARFPHTAAFLGALMWEGSSLAVATDFAPDAVDGWSLGIKYHKHRGNLGMEEEWRGLVRDLGERTGQMHLALASDRKDPDFVPEPLTRDDVESAARSMLEMARDAVSDLENAKAFQGSAGQGMLQELFAALDGMRPIQALVNRLLDDVPLGVKTRVHGDYHLGQVLYTERGFLIADFEGEPLRSLQERRQKRPPARDVAGMLRSLAYLEASDRHSSRVARFGSSSAEGEAFLAGWRQAVGDSPLSDESLLPIFLLEKAFYELRYELRHRPDWVQIPLQGLVELCRSLE